MSVPLEPWQVLPHDPLIVVDNKVRTVDHPRGEPCRLSESLR